MGIELGMLWSVCNAWPAAHPCALRGSRYTVRTTTLTIHAFRIEEHVITEMMAPGGWRALSHRSDALKSRNAYRGNDQDDKRCEGEARFEMGG